MAMMRHLGGLKAALAPARGWGFKLGAGSAVLAVVLAACSGGGASPTATAPAATPREPTAVPTPAPPDTGSGKLAAPRPPEGPPPPVDTAVHGVPLQDVVFDTFQGGFIRLPDASPATIERLRDAIRPIYTPRYEGPEGGDWLDPDNLVLGFEAETAAFAYPIRMLNSHEIVNDEIDGVPVLITYCPLCGSGIVFRRVVDGRELVFGNTSALFESDLVMYDHQTGSYWFQSGGEAIVGTLTGRRLGLLPSVMLPWRDWLTLHPDTRVLSRDQGFGRRRYAADVFEGYGERLDRLQFPFPVSIEKLDDRLRPSTVVISVRAAGQEKAYPLAALSGSVVNDAIGDEPVVVVVPTGGLSGRAFSRRHDGETLTFELRDGDVRDRETGSRWDFAGRAVEGPLAGQELEPLPTRRAFWFSLSLALPGIPLYQE
ncbi:MAG: DUF3179 domain-containing protein [Dehalococcoidia bacterium]